MTWARASTHVHPLSLAQDDTESLHMCALDIIFLFVVR